MRLLAPLAALVACLARPCAAFKQHGVVDSLDSWLFLSRFAFKATPVEADVNEDKRLKKYGLLNYKVKYDNLDIKPTLLLYFAGFDQWTKVYNSGWSCDEKVQEAAYSIQLYGNPHRFGKVTKIHPNGMVEFEGKVYFKTSAPKYFFVAVSHCVTPCTPDFHRYPFCQGPLRLKYWFHFTNGNRVWRREFSYDERTLYPVLITMGVFQFIMCAVSWRLHGVMKRRRKLHHTVRMLVWSIWLHGIALSFRLAHTATYARDGVGSPACEVAGHCITALAEAVMILQLILLAKGWTIVRRKISGSGRVKVAIYITFFLQASISLQIWRFYGFNPATEMYFYTTTPGIVMIFLRVYATMWFWYACYTTMHNYSRKAHFYRKFLVIFTLWFVAIPVMILVTNSVAATSRSGFMSTWELVLLGVGQFILLAMYNPDTRCNKSFPFHKNTAADLGLAARRAAKALGAGSTMVVGGAGAGTDGVYDGTSVLASAQSAPAPTTRGELYRRMMHLGEAMGEMVARLGDLSQGLVEAVKDWAGEDETDVDYDDMQPRYPGGGGGGFAGGMFGGQQQQQHGYGGQQQGYGGQQQGYGGGQQQGYGGGQQQGYGGGQQQGYSGQPSYNNNMGQPPPGPGFNNQGYGGQQGGGSGGGRDFPASPAGTINSPAHSGRDGGGY